MTKIRIVPWFGWKPKYVTWETRSHKHWGHDFYRTYRWLWFMWDIKTR